MNRKLIAVLIVALMVVSTIGVISVTAAAPKADVHRERTPTYMVLRASNAYPEPDSVVALTVTLKAWQGPAHNYPLANKYIWLYILEGTAATDNWVSSQLLNNPALVKTNAQGQARVFLRTDQNYMRTLSYHGLSVPTVKAFAIFSDDGHYARSMSNVVGIRVITKVQTSIKDLQTHTFTLTGRLSSDRGDVRGRLVQLLKSRCPLCTPQATGIYARTRDDGTFTFRLDPRGLPGQMYFAVEFKGDHLYKGSVSERHEVDIPGPQR